MSSPLRLNLREARRFHLRALGLETAFPDVQTALEHHGYVQLDPINVCGRMHDLILRNRVAGYCEDGLLDHVYPEQDAARRPAFEQYLPGQGIIVTFPWAAWRFLVPHLEQRRREKRGYGHYLTAKEEKIAKFILKELSERGPLTSDAIKHDGQAQSAWGTQGRLVKIVLASLFVQGRVMITDRRNFRRVYDLPERVLPKTVLKQKPATLEESRRWLILQKLRQRRLVILKRGELPLVEDAVQQVDVEGCPPLHCLREDVPLLECASEAEELPKALRLLAPLDPLIYDRVLTRKLWGFDYTWEVYTPAAKRVRGYYALPVLAGLDLVGHIDPKADRQSRRLQVCNRRVQRGHRAAPAVKELASFLGLRR